MLIKKVMSIRELLRIHINVKYILIKHINHFIRIQMSSFIIL